MMVSWRVVAHADWSICVTLVQCKLCLTMIFAVDNHYKFHQHCQNKSIHGSAWRLIIIVTLQIELNHTSFTVALFPAVGGATPYAMKNKHTVWKLCRIRNRITVKQVFTYEDVALAIWCKTSLGQRLWANINITLSQSNKTLGYLVSLWVRCKHQLLTISRCGTIKTFYCNDFH